MAEEAQENGKPFVVDHVTYWPIQATIWKSVREGTTSFTATVEKAYKVKDGAGNETSEIKASNFIDERLTPLAAKALNDAHSRIQELKAAKKAG